jgi:flotillin
VERIAIATNQDWIDSWKVLMTKAQGTSAAVETKFLTKPIIAPPGSACTETYLVAGRFNNETEANAKKAAYNANQKVAEQEARQRAEVVAKQADGQIRVADQLAQRDAEEARAKREESRLKAEQVVPADIAKTKLVIESEAQKQQRTIVAEGDALALLTKMRAEAEGTLVKMKAEAAGTQAILDAKAEGYRKRIEGASADPQTAASLLVIEKLTEVAHIQAQAVSKLPLEKIIVWDGGGNGEGLKGLGGRLLGALPPMHQIAGMVGLDLPEYLGKVQKHEEPKKP